MKGVNIFGTNFLKENRYLILVLLISLIIFHQYIVLISLLIFFGVIGLFSFKITRYIPHISVETVTASSVFLGYVYGWKIGLGFGIIAGMYGYIKNSMVKLKPIINVLLMGLCGVIGAIFASLNYSFIVSYMLTFVIRIILNFLVFPLIEPDMFENVLHGLGDPIFNMLITFQFMNLIYIVLSTLNLI